jgi:choice-of-anchor C domain-containing protein
MMLAVAGLISATTSSPAVAGGPVLREGFETPVVAGSFVRLPVGTQIGHFTVTRGNVDLVANNLWQASEGRQSLDLAGDVQGSVATTFDTVPLITYRVRYALAGNPNSAPVVKTAEVSVNNHAVQQASFETTGRTNADMGYVQHTFYFLTTASSVTLEFASTTVPAPFGPVIDDVRVDSCLLVLCPRAHAISVR